VSIEAALFGLLVGFLVGLTGVGGGSLMTPFLVTVMGVPAPTAIGTDMVYATATKLTGSWQHYRQRSINLEVALFLGIGSIPASLFGVWTLEWIKNSFNAGRVDAIMITVIAITLVVVGGSLIFRTFMPERWTERKQHRWDGKGRMTLKRRVFTIVFGAVGGYLVGLTSIGSGSIMAVILLLLYPLSPAVIVGTDIAHATVLSLVTGLAHMTQGNVDFGLVGTLLVGSIPGVLLGSRVAPWLPSRPLKIVLSIMLIFVGTTLLITH
jgi:uncharacterized membrane protein YfcA